MIYYSGYDTRKLNGIYIIKSLLDDRFYIGSATNFYKRYGRHLSELKNQKHSNKILQNFFNHYGEESLSFEILLIVEDKTTLKIIENEYIKILNPSFNIRKDVFDMSHIPPNILVKSRKSRKGMKLSKEHKEKISLGKIRLYREKGHHYTGRTIPEDIKLKMKKTHQLRAKMGKCPLSKLNQKGENHPRSIMTEEQIKMIKVDIIKGLKPREIMRNNNISYSMLRNIRDERSWKHIKLTNYHD